ncbi:hypothetical protein ACFONL_14400 [Camelimonas fluminis]|uniref:Transposase n=1 Tax=Camelimonas fluminis TaxID=1576911 RepID=A0ABV7UJD6_9HYPH|nr:hypothetical protein [Camelimonas fluminis]
MTGSANFKHIWLYCRDVSANPAAWATVIGRVGAHDVQSIFSETCSRKMLYLFGLTHFLHEKRAPLFSKMLQSAFRPDGIVWSIRIRSKQGKLEQSPIHVDRELLQCVGLARRRGASSLVGESALSFLICRNSAADGGGGFAGIALAGLARPGRAVLSVTGGATYDQPCRHIGSGQVRRATGRARHPAVFRL